jgi:hypothetical protein
VLVAVFILLEFASPPRRIFIGSHSLPPLCFAVSVLQSGCEGQVDSPSEKRLLEVVDVVELKLKA